MDDSKNPECYKGARKMILLFLINQTEAAKMNDFLVRFKAFVLVPSF